MGQVKIIGIKEVNKAFDKALLASDPGAEKAILKAADIIRAEASRRAPSRSGALKNGIVVEKVGSGAKTSAKIGPDRKVFYGAFIEFGVPAHRVIPKEAKGLQFDRDEFKPGAYHPGLPARPFLRPAFDENIDEALRLAQELVKQEMKL